MHSHAKMALQLSDLKKLIPVRRGRSSVAENKSGRGLSRQSLIAFDAKVPNSLPNNERISAQKMIFFIINDRIKSPTDLAE